MASARRVLGALLVISFVATTGVHQIAPASAHPGPLPWKREVPMVVDTSTTVDTVKPGLVGVNLSGQPAHAEDLEALGPRFVRLDAGIHELWDCDGGLDPAGLDELQQRLDEIEALGAEPFVILAYMPECLAAPGGLGLFGKSRRPPADPAAWQAAVEDVLGALVTDRIAEGKQPALWFETWNEPDFLLFYDGTPQQFADQIFAPQLRAAAAVEATAGVDLRVGGCACVMENRAWVDRLARTAESEGTELGFVSWHFYANLPFLGPDGQEPLVGPEFFPIWRIVGRKNPFADPRNYRFQAERMGKLYPNTPLVVSEWNLVSGGFDRRMDTHAGAAFQAAALIAMQAGGLDASTVFRARDRHIRSIWGTPLPEWHGEWGLVTRDGAKKPAWHAQRLWGELASARYDVRGDVAGKSGVSVVASGDGMRHTLLAASFTAMPWAHAHRLDVRFEGLDPGDYDVAITRIDASHSPEAGPHETVTLAVGSEGTGRLGVSLPAQSVVFLEIVPF